MIGMEDVVVKCALKWLKFERVPYPENPWTGRTRSLFFSIVSWPDTYEDNRPRKKIIVVIRDSVRSYQIHCLNLLRITFFILLPKLDWTNISLLPSSISLSFSTNCYWALPFSSRSACRIRCWGSLLWLWWFVYVVRIFRLKGVDLKFQYISSVYESQVESKPWTKRRPALLRL